MSLLEQAREVITRAELARRLGVSRAAVTQAAQAGRLGEAARSDGKIWWPDAARNWRINRDPQAELEEAPGPEVPPGPGYRDERAQTERVRRQLLEIELEEKQDRLRPRAEVEAAMTTCGRRLRDRLGREVERWAQPLAQLTCHNEAALRAWLRDRATELQQALAESLAGVDDSMQSEEEVDDEAA